jgi:hypothetical protein
MCCAAPWRTHPKILASKPKKLPKLGEIAFLYKKKSKRESLTISLLAKMYSSNENIFCFH